MELATFVLCLPVMIWAATELGWKVAEALTGNSNN